MCAKMTQLAVYAYLVFPAYNCARPDDLSKLFGFPGLGPNGPIKLQSQSVESGSRHTIDAAAVSACALCIGKLSCACIVHMCLILLEFSYESSDA